MQSRAGLSIPETLGKLGIGGSLPTYVEDLKKVITNSNCAHNVCACVCPALF